MTAGPEGLLTARLRLRRLAARDLAAFVAYRQVPEVARFQGWTTSYAMHDAEALLADMEEVTFDRHDAWMQWAIEDLKTGALAGDLAIHVVDEHQIEVGFTIAPAFQRQGIATEALVGLLGHVFEKRGRHRVFAVTDADNRAARGLLESVGFRLEAHHVEHVRFKGAWGDECVYAMLRREWPPPETP